MNLGLIALIIEIVFTFLSGIATLLRCISRIFLVRNFGIDDVFALLAWSGAPAATFLMHKEYQHGLGRNVDQVDSADAILIYKYRWAGVLVYALTMSNLKLSALLQYLRFLCETRHRVSCWISLILNLLCGIASVSVCVFSCRPLAYFWDRSIPNGKCINLLAWWYFASAWVILTDIAVVVIPIRALKGLTMQRSQKRALMGVFALGGIGCIASVLRLKSVYVAATSTNPTRDIAPLAWWSSIETNIGMICISLPPLKPLVVAINNRMKANQNRVAQDEMDISAADTIRLQKTSSLKSDSTTRQHNLDPWDAA